MTDDLIKRVEAFAEAMADHAGTIKDPAIRANDPSTPQEVAKAYRLGLTRAKREIAEIGGPLVNNEDGDWDSWSQATEGAWAAGMVYNPAKGIYVGPSAIRARCERAYYIGWLRGLR